MEYKEGDKVTVNGSIAMQQNGHIMVRVTCPGGWQWILIEPDLADIRPRADGAKPETTGDVAKLRAAVTLALTYLEYPARYIPESKLETIRAALAEAPAAEGPVRVGDTVRLEGEVVEIHEQANTALIRVPSTGLRTVWLFDVTIVSRPKPAETCGQCRWMFAGVDYHQCMMDRAQRKRSDPICEGFEKYAAD